jgi:hypothetical protein
MCIHELGHIVSAWFSQGAVEKVVLVPWKFSQTVITGSNNPLMDVWAGPALGVLIPVVIWVSLKKFKKENFYIGVFTGFCLLANGLYIGVGWIDKVGDTGDILNHNGSVASMVAFGLICSIYGFYIWHKCLEGSKANKDQGLKAEV